MSLRTPRADGLAVAPNAAADANNPAASIEELQAHRFWGRYAEAADFPNASGNAATSPAYDLMRPGDVAWDQATSLLYQLVDRGTSGGSDAIWTAVNASAGVRQLTFFRSPTDADFYQAAAGVMPGADDFVISIYVRWEAFEVPSGGAAYRAAASQSASAGWEILWVFGQFRFSVIDGAGNAVDANMGASWWDAAPDFAYMQNRDVVLTMRVFQSGGVTNVEGFISGALVATASAIFPNVNPSTGVMTFLGGTSPWQGGGHGIAYYEGTVSDADILEHADACLGQARLVAGPIPWDNLWDADDNTPGATWAPTIGADNLTEQGATTLFQRYSRPG